MRNNIKPLKLVSTIIILVMLILVCSPVLAEKKNSAVRVTELSVGRAHCLAILSDGTLWAWGGNDSGQLGDGTQFDKASPVQIGKDKDWFKISAGEEYSLALKKDGSLWAWGSNEFGQLGDGTIDDKLIPVKISSGKFAKIAAGYGYSLAIGTNGTLWESGLMNQEFTAYDKRYYIAKLKQVGKNTDWKYVSVGFSFALALRSDGTIWGFGGSGNGQLMGGHLYQWSRLGTRNDWIKLCAGESFTIAQRKDGSLWRWGFNGADDDLFVPTQVGKDKDWSCFSAYVFTAAVKSDGTLWTWGQENGSGQIYEYNMTKSAPHKISNDNDWSAVETGGAYAIALKKDGTLWSWGYNPRGQLGTCDETSIVEPVRIGGSNDWAQVSAGNRGHSLAIKTDGTLWAWGSSFFGECGPDSLFNNAAPVQVGTDKDWIKAFSIECLSFGIKKDGTLWAWGDNSHGQFGNGNKRGSATPELIGMDLKWKDIASSNGLIVGLDESGALWIWGSTYVYMRTSEGTSQKEILNPCRVGKASDWTEISTGPSTDSFSAVKNDGTIWSFTYSNNGIGNDMVFKKLSPENDWIDFETGYQYSVMMKADYSLWYNFEGGIIRNAFSPTRLGKEKEWKTFSVDNSHVLAIKSDGSLWAFGENLSAELGDGTFAERKPAVRVGKESDWIQVSAGLGYSTGIRKDGSLWAWGNNSYYNYKLGIPQNANRTYTVKKISFS